MDRAHVREPLSERARECAEAVNAGQETDRLRARVASIDWYHTIELGPGVVTPGWLDHRPIVDRVALPRSLAGLRCLDIGTFNGFWAFEMERRGAEVIGIDVLDPDRWDWPVGSDDATIAAISQRMAGGEGFEIARAVLDSSVKRLDLSVYDLDERDIGRFDLVYLGSLLVHLRDPVRALERVRAVCAGTLIVVDGIDLPLSLRHRLVPVARLDGRGRPWWWYPNAAGLARLVEAGGFDVLDGPRRLFVPPGAGWQPQRWNPRLLRSREGRYALTAAWLGDPHSVVVARRRTQLPFREGRCGYRLNSMPRPFSFDREQLKQLAGARRDEYAAAQPFPHVVVDDFLPEWILDEVLTEFPSPQEDAWWRFDSENERKLAARDDSRMGDATRQLLAEFNSAAFVDFLEELTGIDGLVPDPHFDGGGLHQIVAGGHLNVHVDFNRHPRTGLDRRLNALVYLNRDWDEEYGGALELWRRDQSHCEKRILPLFNRLVVFSTTEHSFHGHPEPLRCPEGRTRKSLALYYYSNGRPEEGGASAPAHNTIWKGEVRDGSRPRGRVKAVVRQVTPPVLLDAARAARRRARA